MSKIKFIFFDVGGVLIKDFSKTDKFNALLSDLGLNQIQKDNFIEQFSEKEEEICRGLLDCGDFLRTYPDYSQLRLKEEYSLCQDFVDRFELNTSIHDLADRLAKKYRVGLLTNMYLGMLDKIKQRELLPKVKWDIEVDSSLVNLAKPNTKYLSWLRS
jgi:FMN phosphatase YigB (HAD superfamily)